MTLARNWPRSTAGPLSSRRSWGRGWPSCIGKRRDNAIAPLFDAVQEELGGYTGVTRWLVEMREDVLENLQLFGLDGEEGKKAREA